jgi:purine-binding chemotaxis protein CheW
MHVHIRVAGERYAVDVGSVREVVEIGEVTPLVGAPGCVLGVRNLRGQAVGVFDLARVLGLQRDAAPERLLVVACGDEHVGLAVDHVLDVEAITATEDAGVTGLLTGAALTDGALVGVVDLPAVLAALEAEVGS